MEKNRKFWDLGNRKLQNVYFASDYSRNFVYGNPCESADIPLGRKTVFSEVIEEGLVECLLIMEKENFALTRIDLVVWHTS